MSASVRLLGVRTRWAARGIKPRGPTGRLSKYSCRFYSLKIEDANLTHESPDFVPQNKSISQYLQDYKEAFPYDEVSKALIESYERLHTFPQETIKIGVLYHNDLIRDKSRVFESMLADPLASNNEIWFNEILNRDKTLNNQFLYSDEMQIMGNTFNIPSPVLSAIARPKFMVPDTSITLNDILLYEINDLTNFNRLNYCHFFVYVTNNITLQIKLPSTISDRILVTLLDNSDFTPTSRESTPVTLKTDGTSQIIKVDTEKSFNGILEFLKYDTKASDKYLDSLVESNIFQFLKVFGYNLQIHRLVDWNLTNFLNKLSRDEITIQNLESLYNELKNKEISSFSSQMHYELQNSFMPKTAAFFNKNLRWWKLYFKNDNVEYDLKDYFQRNFMNESIENYNFLRGRIISSLQNHEFGNYKVREGDIHNPLIRMKNHLINKRIREEIQPVVNSSLFYGMLYYQLPISILSGCAYQIFEFSANASTSLFVLGMVMGFNHVSKTWEKFTKAWLSELFEDTRVCIDKDCVENGLVKELTDSYNEEKEFITIKRTIREGVKSKIELD